MGSRFEEHLGVLETVRCLECSAVYAKPSGGGTMRANPGCPSCGYVGWIPVSGPGGHASQRRPGADPRPALRGRRG